MTKTNFRYDLNKIKELGGYTTNFEVKEIENFKDCFSNLVNLNSINITVNFIVNETSIILNGRVLSNVDAMCSRCGKTYKTSFSENFDELYFNTNEEIDITELVLQSIVLSEPMKNLCSDNCKV